MLFAGKASVAWPVLILIMGQALLPLRPAVSGTEPLEAKQKVPRGVVWETMVVGSCVDRPSRTESLGTRLKQLRGAEARRPSSHREPKRGCALHHDPVPPHPFMNSHMWKSDIMPLLEHAGGARERQKGPLGVASTVCS